jgi:hypothetical protein
MAASAGPAGTTPAGPAGARTPPFASAWRRAHLTVDERVARGRAVRAAAPRSSHGRWAPAPDRPDPVALLEEQGESRVPHLVPIRYARICGATLARAHARWGDRIAVASYLGKGNAFDRAIANFSVAYADQNERDYEAFAAAVKSGRLTAQTGI